MNEKKVMIVTYYWPPCGGSGVQRWLKFAKYLPEFGWKPFVLTPENPSFTIQDESLIKDVPPEVTVRKLPIWEPYSLFFALSRMSGKKKVNQTDFISTGKRSLFQRFSSWVRGNFFIPDARIYWVRPAVNFLNDFLKVEGIETLITTGPPHSIHLIGLKLKAKNPALHWIADFRDPWSEWDLLDTLSLSTSSRRRHARLERDVLRSADKVITIAPYHVARFEALGERKIELVTNGFDTDDFTSIKKISTGKFVIGHVGMVDELRDPRPVMEVIRELCIESSEFAAQVSIQFVGQVNTAFKDYVTSSNELSSRTKFVAHLPHGELLKVYGETDLQLLVLAHTGIAPGNLPGKFFEYLASGNTILGIGPVRGDAAQVLRETGAGEIFERTDRAGVKAFLLKIFQEWKNNIRHDSGQLQQYSRRALTGQLAEILNSVQEKLL